MTRTYATINSAASLYLFSGTPDERYGVRAPPNDKRLWSAEGTITPTQHRTPKYYADVTGMSYADAFSACEAAHAVYQADRRQWAVERERREQERLADMYEVREGEYMVEIPCMYVNSRGNERRSSWNRTVKATSAANAWLKVANSMPPHMITPSNIHQSTVTRL